MLNTAEMYSTVPDHHPMRVGVRLRGNQHPDAIGRFEQSHY
jgi:hypothetical protein